MRLILSTDVSDFVAVLRKFMDGQRVNLLCCFEDEKGNIILHGAYEPKTLIEDVLIEDESPELLLVK